MDTFSFKHLSIDFLSQQIIAHGVPLKLDPKAFSTLKLLIQNKHRVVTSDELIDKVWDGRPINSEVVVSAIGRIRKLFKDAKIRRETIRTIHKVGYKFVLNASPQIDNNLSALNTNHFHKKLNWLLGSALVLFGIIFAVYLTLYQAAETVIRSPEQTIELNHLSKPTQVFFLRHADKEEDGTDDQHLSEIGIKRANYWRKFFQYIQFDAIYTTNFHRNIETAALVVDPKKSETLFYSALSFDILEYLKEFKGKKILIIGHSNTIPDMVNRLVGANQYSPMSHENYNLLYQVTIDPNNNVSSQLFYLDFEQSQPIE